VLAGATYLAHSARGHHYPLSIGSHTSLEILAQHVRGGVVNKSEFLTTHCQQGNTFRLAKDCVLD